MSARRGPGLRGGQMGEPKRKEITTRQYLDAVPVPNEAMDVYPQRDGKQLVEVPLRRPFWMVPPLSWILPYSSHRRVELDALGSEVLEGCDGQQSIEQIIETFAEKHSLTFREGQLAVTTFLRQLTRRGIVAIVGLKESDEA